MKKLSVTVDCRVEQSIQLGVTRFDRGWYWSCSTKKWMFMPDMVSSLLRDTNIWLFDCPSRKDDRKPFSLDAVHHHI